MTDPGFDLRRGGGAWTLSTREGGGKSLKVLTVKLKVFLNKFRAKRATKKLRKFSVWSIKKIIGQRNLNTSDSGLHHTISLMYVGARHLGFGIT